MAASCRFPWQRFASVLIKAVEQEHADIATHARALGQKYMGVRPQSHLEEMFKETSIHLDSDVHPVPVSNFLNAQCTLPYAVQLSCRVI